MVEDDAFPPPFCDFAIWLAVEFNPELKFSVMFMAELFSDCDAVAADMAAAGTGETWVDWQLLVELERDLLLADMLLVLLVLLDLLV